MKKAEGPKGSFIFGSGKSFKNNPLQFLIDTEKEFPDFATFRLGYLKFHLISKPEYIHHVLQKNYKNYRKGLKSRQLQHITGNGMPFAEGEDWKRKRKLAQPAFSRQKIDGMTEIIIRCTQKNIEKWDSKYANRNLEMVAEMKQLTLNIIGETLFSADLSENSKELTEALNYLMDHINSRIQATFNFPIWFPFGGRWQFLKKRKFVHDAIDKIIKDRRNSQNEYSDLLSMLMDTIDEKSGEHLSDKEIKDEIMSMFMTGTESSAVLLSWIMYLVSKDKKIEEKLHKEIKEVLDGSMVSLRSLRDLTYSYSIIEEALRLEPSVWVIVRQAINDDNIDGYEIKKGEGVLMSPYVLHRSGKYWENPDEFNPDRFSPESKQERKSRAYFPFGEGPRSCIGSHFSLMEMHIILVMLFQHYSFTYEGDGDLSIVLGFNLKPKKGIIMKPKLLH